MKNEEREAEMDSSPRSSRFYYEMTIYLVLVRRYSVLVDKISGCRRNSFNKMTVRIINGEYCIGIIGSMYNIMGSTIQESTRNSSEIPICDKLNPVVNDMINANAQLRSISVADPSTSFTGCSTTKNGGAIYIQAESAVTFYALTFAASGSGIP